MMLKNSVQSIKWGIDVYTMDVYTMDVYESERGKYVFNNKLASLINNLFKKKREYRW